MDIEADGLTLHYEVAGPDGAPWVTLSHSIAADLSFWDAQAEALAAGFRVLRYDTRGHGRSGVGRQPYSLDLLARDVVALWDALGIGKSHFVGLSLGGMTGVVLGLDFAPRLDRLVIANARLQADAEFTERWDQRIALAEREGMAPIAEGAVPLWFTGGFISDNPEIIARVRRAIAATPVAGFAGAGRAIRAIDLHRRLAELEAPALFIAGAEDAACPAQGIRADCAATPGAAYVALSPAAHISNLEQPAAFTRAVAEFLAA
ncbi:MAG: alpha/beta fold hydrolase [Alphaproteobacteria bacterium]|nr:alpha/beta fold hydrolase [Alphaproteobacteria bacterium]